MTDSMTTMRSCKLSSGQASDDRPYPSSLTLIPETKVDGAISDSNSREPATRNTAYIGSQKPLMNYVLATLICLNNSPVVILKARGAAISFAVDMAQVTMNRFAPDLRVADIRLGTEQLPSQEGGARNV